MTWRNEEVGGIWHTKRKEDDGQGWLMAGGHLFNALKVTLEGVISRLDTQELIGQIVSQIGWRRGHQLGM